MANEQNLISLKDRTTKEKREIAIKGGIASGIARRERKTMKETLLECLKMTNDKGQTYQDLATIGLLKGAMKGNSNNFELILKVLGELEDANRNKQESEMSKLDELLMEIKGEANR